MGGWGGFQTNSKFSALLGQPQFPPASSMGFELYDALHVPRDATTDQIKRAYRKLALKHHPDKNDGDDATFKRISHAHEVLSDTTKRAVYDLTGQDTPADQPPADFTDLFQHVFHAAAGQQPPRKQDNVDVQLSPLEVLRGGVKHVRIELLCPCSICAATGVQDPTTDVIACIQCGGTGSMTHEPAFGLRISTRCCGCAGRGRTVRTGGHCKRCAGEKTVYHVSDFKLNVSPGVPDGFQHRIEGAGGYDVASGRSNDLLIIFRRGSHADQKYVGEIDVHVTVRITLEELLGGFVKSIDAFKGPDTAFPLVSTGYFDPTSTTVRVQGKGVPVHRSPDGARGDLVISFHVEYPKDAQRVRRFTEAFAKMWRMAPATEAAEGAVAVQPN